MAEHLKPGFSLVTNSSPEKWAGLHGALGLQSWLILNPQAASLRATLDHWTKRAVVLASAINISLAECVSVMRTSNTSLAAVAPPGGCRATDSVQSEGRYRLR